MDLQKRQNRKSQFLISFEREDVETVRAAFGEVIHRKAEEDNRRSLSDLGRLSVSGNLVPQELEAVDPEAEGLEPEVLKLRLKEVSDITDVLDEFVSSTPEAIAEIPQITMTPPFLDDSISERLRLGQAAMTLSAEIKKKAAALEQQAKSLEDASGFDPDTAFSGLLRGDPAN